MVLQAKIDFAEECVPADSGKLLCWTSALRGCLSFNSVHAVVDLFSWIRDDFGDE